MITLNTSLADFHAMWQAAHDARGPKIIMSRARFAKLLLDHSIMREQLKNQVREPENEQV